MHGATIKILGVTGFVAHKFRPTSRNCGKIVLAFPCLAARPHVKQVGSHMMDFY